jgi:transcriptional regulator with XRE-family HTH domain
MKKREYISSGIDGLDALTTGFIVGDNVVWETDSGASPNHFINHFIRQTIVDDQKIIYVCFNKSPASILQKIEGAKSGNLILLDCFTSGKGKDDRTFRDFYKKNKRSTLIRIERPSDIDGFINLLNSIEDKQPSGTRYVFDSLTGMQDLWGGEEQTYKFFTYMCPRLYDLETVAFWLLEKNAHSEKFKANVRHITQVVIDLYKRSDQMFLRALKLDDRGDREAFKSHSYQTSNGDIIVLPPKKDVKLKIGTKLGEARINKGMNQKELAERVGLTASFISQLERNQISPSLNSFVLICNAIGISPKEIWERMSPKKVPWLRRKEDILSSIVLKDDGNVVSSLFRRGDCTGDICFLSPGEVFSANASGGKGTHFAYLLSGKATVSVGGSSVHVSEGDSLFLDDGQLSVWKNANSERAQLLLIRI